MARMPQVELQVLESEKHQRMCFWEWLGLLFIGLRLCGEIDWSWWWVLSPLLFAWIFPSIVRGFVSAYREWKEDVLS